MAIIPLSYDITISRSLEPYTATLSKSWIFSTGMKSEGSWWVVFCVPTQMAKISVYCNYYWWASRGLLCHASLYINTAWSRNAMLVAAFWGRVRYRVLLFTHFGSRLKIWLQDLKATNNYDFESAYERYNLLAFFQSYLFTLFAFRRM